MYRISQRLSERINILKLLLIIMVVFIHASPELEEFRLGAGVSLPRQGFFMLVYILSHSVSRVAVPLYFLISSILLYSKDFHWLGNMRKKCRSILLPYLIWNTFWILLCYTAQHLETLASYFPRDSYYIRDYDMVDWLKAYTYLNGNYPYLYTLWFLRDLFIMNLLSIMIKRAVDKVPGGILALISMVWIGNFNIPYLDNQSVVFFILGYYIVKYKIDIKHLDELNKRGTSITYIIFLLMDYRLSNTYPFLHQISIVVGSLFFIKCSGGLLDRRMGSRILAMSSYTFIIYVFHEMNLSFLKKISSILLPRTLFIQFSEYFVIPALTICGCILFGTFIKRVCPKMYRLATGDREKEVK